MRSPDDVVRRQITYRYNALKSKLNVLQVRAWQRLRASALTAKPQTQTSRPRNQRNASMRPAPRTRAICSLRVQARQHDVFNLVKSKNPSLLLQVRDHGA